MCIIVHHFASFRIILHHFVSFCIIFISLLYHVVLFYTIFKHEFRYGPAIFRVHYAGHDVRFNAIRFAVVCEDFIWRVSVTIVRAHINHVGTGERARELYDLDASVDGQKAAIGKSDQAAGAFAIQRYTHQFAGLICLENSEDAGYDGALACPQATIYRTRPSAETKAALASGPEAWEHLVRNIESCTLDVTPGDFYLFNAGMLHAVPAVVGSTPRIVLATFIGYDEDIEEVDVWA